jgi:mono/diheme cytochrome c family protein
MNARLWAAGLMAALLPMALGEAQEVGSAAAGAVVVGEWCVQCHKVTEADARGGMAGAPVLSAVANRPEVTAIWLQAFFVTPHGRMPDIILSPDQKDDVTAYILSLKQP